MIESLSWASYTISLEAPHQSRVYENHHKWKPTAGPFCSQNAYGYVESLRDNPISIAGCKREYTSARENFCSPLELELELGRWLIPSSRLILNVYFHNHYPYPRKKNKLSLSILKSL
ncbi:hypothetical protein TWF173_011198 [Orbilia oligospora]|nr:hypothetical protein TWF173_011198 [Orbilia oligospora]